MSDALGYLIGDEYADEFFALTGRYPKYVPCSGVWGSERKWILRRV